MPAAVIIGDSQAQGAGAHLETVLKTQGYSVKRWAKPGADSAQVAALASSHAGDAKGADLVVVFSGSTADGAPAGKAVDDIWPAAKVIWYGSSPATRITDPGAAKAVWGAKAAENPSYFFPAEAAAREKRNVELPKLLPARFQYVDWRRLALPGAVVQPSGVAFPSQPDGIHIGAATAKAAFAAPNWPPPANVGVVGLAPDQNALAVIFLLVIAYLWSKG